MDKLVTYELDSGEKKSIRLEPDHFSVDQTNMDLELSSMGKLTLNYGLLETLLRAEVERKEAALERLDAELDSKYRTQGFPDGKVTETRIAGAVKLAPERSELISSLIESRKNYNLAKWACRALQGKRETLIAIAYRERELLRAERY